MGVEPEREEEKSFAEESDSLWHVAFGPVIWAGHFIACYAATAVFCAKIAAPTDPVTDLRIIMGVLTVLALGLIVRVAWQAWRDWDFLDDYDRVHDLSREEDRHEFLGHAGFLLAVLSFVAVIYTAMPAVFIDGCF